MKRLLLFAIVAALGLHVFAQQRKVTGRVRRMRMEVRSPV